MVDKNRIEQESLQSELRDASINQGRNRGYGWVDTPVGDGAVAASKEHAALVNAVEGYDTEMKQVPKRQDVIEKLTSDPANGEMTLKEVGEVVKKEIYSARNPMG